MMKRAIDLKDSGDLNFQIDDKPQLHINFNIR